MKAHIRVSLGLALAWSVLGITVQGAYQYGDAGQDIVAIQKKLIAEGYKARETGEYDANTKWAVRLYQQDHGLDVDGILGANTYQKLMGKPLPKTTKITSKLKEIAKKDAALAKQLDASNNKSVKEAVSKTKVKEEAKRTSKSKAASKQKVSKVKPGGKQHHEQAFTGVTGNVKTVLSYANTFTGVPYKFGGTTPAGFDCSGYTRHVFAKVGVNLPRQADEQYEVGRQVEKKNLQPGDLVFFETYEPGISHSGIYVGDGQFISATSSSGVAIADINDSYWGPRYVGAKRVL